MKKKLVFWNLFMNFRQEKKKKSKKTSESKSKLQDSFVRKSTASNTNDVATTPPRWLRNRGRCQETQASPRTFAARLLGQQVSKCFLLYLYCFDELLVRGSVSLYDHLPEADVMMR